MMRAWRDLIRAWRGGELALLGFSLVLAVTIVSGIAGFSDRLSRGMEQQSHHFLAADRVLKSTRPVTEDILLEARKRGLRTATVVSFRTMLMAGDAMQLASVRAVSDDYPLLGEVGVSKTLFGPAEMHSGAPASGKIWLDSRLLALMEADIDSDLGLGDSQFNAEFALLSEPDRGNMNEMLAPRALINLADLDAAGVVQPGSLVDYRYLFTGDARQLDDYARWLTPQLALGQKWQDVRDGQPAMATTLRRAEGYLLLAASLGVALAGAAVALAARRYGERNSDNVAVMKTLGAVRRQILAHYLSQLTLLCLLASGLGALAGFALQWALFASLGNLIDVVIPPASWRPALVGLVTATSCTAIFALPPVLRLSKVSPLRVLRRDGNDDSSGLLASAIIGVFGMTALMWWYSDNILLSGAVLAASLCIALLATILVLGLIGGARRFTAAKASGPLRLALSAIYRRRYGNAFQVASFALALMVLCSLWVLRSSLLADWQLQLSDGAPNHFLINIQPDEREPLAAFFSENGLSHAGLYPMVRGRLSEIDSRALTDIPNIDADSGSVNREMNLSWAEDLPADNRLTAGVWWPEVTADARGLTPVSVEADFAKKLKLELGSELVFDVGGQILAAQVSSIRSLDWASMRPNFYFMFPPDSLQNYAGSFITSFYLAPDRKTLLTDLLRQFPTLTLIEIDAVIKQMSTVVGQLSIAIGLVLVLITLCALLVSIANVQASLDGRLQENAILRTLGASRAIIASGLLLEFAAMGLLAGLLAALGSNITLYGVQRWMLEMQPVWHFGVFLVAPPLGTMVMCSSGWAFCRRVVSTPPLLVLRQG
jgi:putative ABC transport system permease protein